MKSQTFRRAFVSCVALTAATVCVALAGKNAGLTKQARAQSDGRDTQTGALTATQTGARTTQTDAQITQNNAPRIANEDEVVLRLREGLRGRAQSITVRFTLDADVFDTLDEAVDDWMTRALDETAHPAEGDYIRCQYGGFSYRIAYATENGAYAYEATITPDYYTYLSQENEVDALIDEIVDELALDEAATDAEKIRRCYDYVCANVKYDKVRRKNPYDHTPSTAYAALTRRTATCQGYCATLYRLLKEAGVSCRVITGEAGTERRHAWMIAQVGDAYYLLDPTFDAQKETYDFFLIGADEAADRVPDAQFTTQDFCTRYPTARQSYRMKGTTSE